MKAKGLYIHTVGLISVIETPNKKKYDEGTIFLKKQNQNMLCDNLN